MIATKLNTAMKLLRADIIMLNPPMSFNFYISLHLHYILA